MPRRVLDRLAVGAFALLLAAPSIDRVVRDDEARSTVRENRAPAARPLAPSGTGEVSRFPAAFEAWVADTLGLRDLLLRARARLVWTVFARSPSPLVYRARDATLFFDTERSRANSRGVVPFTRAELEAWALVLEDRSKRMRERGVRYVFAPAPEKQSIYRHAMPASDEVVGPTRLDQLFARLEGRVECLDLRPRLREEAALDQRGDPAYFPYGTHWTSRGAWAAADEIAQRLRAAFPAIRREPRDDMQHVEPPSWFDDTIAPALYLEDVLVARPTWYVPRSARRTVNLERLLGDPRERITEIEDPGLPRALVLHDSFGQYVQPHLAEHASRCTFAWVYAFSDALVSRERPDVVIEMYAERALQRAPSADVRSASSIDVAAHRARPREAWKLVPGVSGFQLEGGVTSSRVLVDGEPAVVLATSDVRHHVELGALELDGASSPSVLLRGTASAPFLLDVFYATPSSPKLSRIHAVHVELAAGEVETCFELPREARAPIALRLGASDLRLVVKELDVRTE